MKWVTAFAALVMAVACTSTAPKDVRFSDSWPDKTRPYNDVTRDWTRHGRVMSGYDKALEVYATIKSPEWRSAYVARRAKRDGLGEAERAALIASEKKADAAHYEVHLRVTTFDRRENNLHQRDRAHWRVALVDDKGRRIEPAEVVRDRRPRGLLRTYFGKVDDFAESYIARFPRASAVMGAGTSRVSLRFSSGHGAVNLVWRQAR